MNPYLLDCLYASQTDSLLYIKVVVFIYAQKIYLSFISAVGCTGKINSKFMQTTLIAVELHTVCLFLFFT